MRFTGDLDSTGDLRSWLDARKRHLQQPGAEPLRSIGSRVRMALKAHAIVADDWRVEG